MSGPGEHLLDARDEGLRLRRELAAKQSALDCLTSAWAEKNSAEVHGSRDVEEATPAKPISSALRGRINRKRAAAGRAPLAAPGSADAIRERRARVDALHAEALAACAGYEAEPEGGYDESDNPGNGWRAPEPTECNCYVAYVANLPRKLDVVPVHALYCPTRRS